MSFSPVGTDGLGESSVLSEKAERNAVESKPTAEIPRMKSAIRCVASDFMISTGFLYQDSPGTMLSGSFTSVETGLIVL